MIIFYVKKYFFIQKVSMHYTDNLHLFYTRCSPKNFFNIDIIYIESVDSLYQFLGEK